MPNFAVMPLAAVKTFDDTTYDYTPSESFDQWMKIIIRSIKLYHMPKGIRIDLTKGRPTAEQLEAIKERFFILSFTQNYTHFMLIFQGKDDKPVMLSSRLYQVASCQVFCKDQDEYLNNKIKAIETKASPPTSAPDSASSPYLYPSSQELLSKKHNRVTPEHEPTSHHSSTCHIS